MHIPWDPSYSVGVEEIDMQHKHFLELLNKAYDAVYLHERKDTIPQMMSSLVEYADLHFATEEKYFAEFGYADSEVHIAAHRSLKKTLLSFKRAPDQDEFELLKDILDFLENWLVEHLMSVDKKYVSCFHEHGLR